MLRDSRHSEVELVRVANARTFVMLDQPDALAAAMLSAFPD